MRLQVEHCIAAGAHGIMVLGLVTEVHKMDVDERRHVVDDGRRAIAGRVPYAVTVGEPTIPGQIAFARRRARGRRATGSSCSRRRQGLAEAEVRPLLRPGRRRARPAGGDPEQPGQPGRVAVATRSLLALAPPAPEHHAAQGRGHRGRRSPALIEARERRASTCSPATAARSSCRNLRSGCAGLIPAPDCLDCAVAHLRVDAGR